MRIFKVKWLARFARRERLPDRSLAEAVRRAERGVIDADLGSNLIKQRVARTGQGRSGGYRVLIAFKTLDRAVFLYGFAKNERENIDPDQLLSLRSIAKGWIGASTEQIATAVAAGVIEEVEDHES